MITIQLPVLKEKVAKVFQSFGHDPDDAFSASNALIMADIWGISTHGVQRLPHYAKLYAGGVINTKATPHIIAQTPSTATLDGEGGLGLIVAQEAMSLAIAKAKKCGTGWVAVRNSSHFGCGSFFTQQALQENMIGVALSNASPVVAPKGSCERVFGTNPIAVAFPTPTDVPFSFDFSTSMATCGLIEAHAKMGNSLPLGVVVDAEGSHTTNVLALDQNGSILPLGYNAAFDNSHKGYALGGMVDLFCGVLSGASFGKWVPSFTVSNKTPTEQVGQGTGHFFGALSIEAFRPMDEYNASMRTWLKMVKEAKPTSTSSTVLLPGEREANAQKKNEAQGLRIPEKILQFIDSFSS